MRRARRGGPSPALVPAKAWHWIWGTWFGSGFSPITPGTAGTAATLPLVALLGLCFPGFRFFNPACFLAGLLFFYPGVLAATAIEKATGIHDDGRIVVDETVGTLFTFSFVSPNLFHHPWAYFIGFVFFRVIDIWKPWIIDMAQSLPRGWGVMTDDALGGLVVGLLFGASQYFWAWS